MVVLNKIYTRTGDAGTTAIGSGERIAKSHIRITAYGTVDETNSAIGIARLSTTGEALANVDNMLLTVQNDLFDLGADLCTPDTGAKLDYEPLRITDTQWQRLEHDIDQLNNSLEPLRSFVLPAGHAGAAHLHLARTISRRAERHMVELAALPDETVSHPAMVYINRLSDFLFVAARHINAIAAKGDVLWVPGKSR